jgi:omega-6 fatty acid desaturase (delta-12 desaturase)
MNPKENNGPSWVAVIRNYNQPDVRKSIGQIIDSLGPYLALWVLMYFALGISYWITLGLSVFAAGFLVRIFIIFHDCGHGAFFRSARANRVVGTILGALVFTPYDRWHRDHAIHHSTVGNLDKRGNGDIWTLTVDEYRALTPWGRFVYRLYRHPVILIGIGPFLLFVLWFRFPKKGLTRQERRNSHVTNLIIMVWVAGLILLMGWKAFLLIQVPVIYFATAVGTWLFYVQHQFEDVIWTRHKSWDYKEMALNGSSYLKLPRLLQWFTGNIGFHHIHHLSPRIPNYNLERCHRENPMFSSIKPVTPVKGIFTMKFRLWDEQVGRLISFRQFRKSSVSM